MRMKIYKDDYSWLTGGSPHVSLPDLGDDLTRLLQRPQHLRRLLPPLADVLALGEEALYLVSLVEARHQLALEIVLHEVHHEVHYSLEEGLSYRCPDICV